MSSPIEILWTTTAFECSLADEKGRILARGAGRRGPHTVRITGSLSHLDGFPMLSLNLRQGQPLTLQRYTPLAKTYCPSYKQGWPKNQPRRVGKSRLRFLRPGRSHPG